MIAKLLKVSKYSKSKTDVKYFDLKQSLTILFVLKTLKSQRKLSSFLKLISLEIKFNQRLDVKLFFLRKSAF